LKNSIVEISAVHRSVVLDQPLCSLPENSAMTTTDKSRDQRNSCFESSA
jgi:hypothetical protein